MKKVSIYLTASFIPVASALATDFPTGNNIQPLSKTGAIQNVQSYSSNPFWNPNGPYNQTMPKPVYVQGADLNTAECQSVVSQLVSSVCSSQNNCTNVKLNDIKPTIMVQLSNMSGHNYVSSCGGFIDSAFNTYLSQQGSTVQGTNFPTAAFPGNNSEQEEFKIKNPYALKYPEWNGEKWYEGIVDRTKELNNLQAQNAEDYTLKSTDMPTTVADLSFKERVDNATEGYEQWTPVYGTNSKGEKVCVKNCAYSTLNIEKDETYIQREQQKNGYRSNPTGVNNNNINKTVPSNVTPSTSSGDKVIIKI